MRVVNSYVEDIISAFAERKEETIRRLKITGLLILQLICFWSGIQFEQWQFIAAGVLLALGTYALDLRARLQ